MKFDLANLKLRTLTAVVLAPFVLLSVYVDGWWYVAIVSLVVALGLREWLPLTRPSVKLALLAIPYFGGFGYALFYLRNAPDIGRAMVYYVLLVVWATDIGAFISGKFIGGPKMSPVLSPGKTWAGLIGGMLLAAITGCLVAIFAHAKHPVAATIIALVLAVIAQMGDLFESWLKRQTGAKDSGICMPGHGGMLDRIDGLVFAAIVFAIFYAATKAHTNWW